MDRRLRTTLVIIIVLLLSVTIPYTILQFQYAGASADWYNYNWQYRINMTVDHNKVQANISNFPMMIHITNANLSNSSRCQTNGNDIMFIANGTKLNHEIEYFNSTTGELVAYVNITLSNITDVPLQMYYGNPGATNQQNVTGTWESSYVGIWHMNDVTNSTIKDSTGYYNNGTKKGANEPAQSTGLNGLAQYFDGINDYVNVSSSSSLNPSNCTLEVWFKPNSTYDKNQDYNQGLFDKGSYQVFLDKSDGKIKTEISNDSSTWILSYNGLNNSVFSLAVYNGSLYAGTGTGTGRGDVYKFNSTSKTWSMSFNGSQEEIDSLAVFNGKLYAGQGSTAGDGDVYEFNGTTWALSYNNATATRVKSLCPYNGKLYAGMASGSNGGGDVWVYNNTAWARSYDNVTAREVEALAVYNGKLYAGLGSQAGTGDLIEFNGTTWKRVYDGNGLAIFSLAAFDGKLYMGNGTTSTTTNVGEVLIYDNGTVTISYNGAYQNINALTVYDANIYAGQGSATGNGDVYWAPATGGWTKIFEGAQEYIHSLAMFEGNLYAGQGTGTGDGDVYYLIAGNEVTTTTNNWSNAYHYVASTYNNETSSNLKMFFNGTLQANVTSTVRIVGTSYLLKIGMLYGTRGTGDGPGMFNGYIDEIRISNVARSIGYVKTVSNNMNDPNSFLVQGGGGARNDPPSTPTGLGPTTRQISPSATINATSTDNDTTITMYFYNNVTKAEIGNVSGTSGGNFTVAWSGLSKGTDYYFYAAAYDGQNWSSNSSVCTFRVNSLPYCTNFNTENQTDPVRVGSLYPYFNWTLNDNESDSQTMYRVQVGSTLGGSDLWDSGQVSSANKNAKYNGSALTRGTIYYVRVIVYDGYEWSTW